MKRLFLIAALSLATACAGTRPAVPDAASVLAPMTWRNDVSATGLIDADWWRGFGDPQLSKIVEAALAANPDVAIAATRVAEARAQYDLSRAQLLPNINLQAAGVHERDLSPFGRGATEYASRGELTASYDLDLFGRLSSAKGAARAALFSSEASQANVSLAVAASAARGYINLRALDARLDLLQQTLEARAASVHVEERRARVGYSSQLELAQAQAEYQSTAQLIPSIRLAIARQEDGLRILLGQNPGDVTRGEELYAITEPAVPQTLPSQLLRRRPDIIAAEDDLVGAERSLDSARAAFMPQIRLAASGGYVAADPLPDNPVDVFSLGASVLAPIFDAGRLNAQQHVAAARRDRAAYAYQRTALNAFAEVEDALAAITRTREQEDAINAQREALAHALRLATNRYRAGYSTYLEELDAQRGLLSADLQRAQIRVDRLNSAISLFQALGGGWDPG